MKANLWLALSLALVITLRLQNLVAAASPEIYLTQANNRQVSLESTSTACLVVPTGVPANIATTVRLEWKGDIEAAFLVLTAAGSEGGHGLYVNGQRVGHAPVRPAGQPCQAGSSYPVFIPMDKISVPVELLRQGENEITLTNEANINDGWTAANLHLEIHGVLSGPPVALLEDPTLAVASLPTIAPQNMTAMAVVTGSVVLTSSYDGIQQVSWYQIPNGYTGGNPTPLLIGLHGWGGTGKDEINGAVAVQAGARGWLFAAPDMHGRYYTNHGKYAFAWPGAQHDIIDTVKYMRDNFNVDTTRIYIAGGSMGGQTTATTAAKYPDVFAAAGPWKPITDLADMLNLPILGYGWIIETIMKETDPSCLVGDPYNYGDDNPPGCGKPSYSPAVLFEYQRRSAVQMPQNDRLIPLRLWHDIPDQLVVIAHSDKLKAALDSWNPTTPVTLHRVNTGTQCTDGYYHCYNPPPLPFNFSIPASNVFDFLAGFTLSSQPPQTITIRTDESKPYYWLKVTQTGGEHWTEVIASCNLTNTVTAVISDTVPLTIAFNLGSTSLPGSAGIPKPGLGLPAATYTVMEVGANPRSFQQNYSGSGYFTVALQNIGQVNLTISLPEPCLKRVYLPVVVKNN